MAKNREQERGNQISLDVSAVNGSGVGDLVKSGDPGAVGSLPFVALTDEGEDTTDHATCQTDGVWRLPVTGTDDAGNSAVAPGQIVYWDNGEGQLNKEATGGVRFGYALGAVGSGLTGTILVKLGY